MQKEKNICDILKFEEIMSGGFGIAPRIVMLRSSIINRGKSNLCLFSIFCGKP